MSRTCRGLRLVATLLACGPLAAAEPDAEPPEGAAVGPAVVERPAGESEAAAALAEPDGPLGFVRVNVPAGSETRVPLGPERYVPMPLADFEAALARAGAGGPAPRAVVAAAARYVLRRDGSDALVGSVEFDVVSAAGGFPVDVPLGPVEAERASLRTAGGTGDVAVFGLPGGGSAVRAAGPGAYRCDLRMPAAFAAGRVTIPLVPALATTVDIDLPATPRPVPVGPGTALVEPRGDGDGWRISLAPADRLTLLVREPGPPSLTAFTDIVVRGRQAGVATHVVPRTAWLPGPVELRLDGDLRIVSAAEEPTGGRPQPLEFSVRGATATVTIPPRLAGGRTPLVVKGLAEAPVRGAWRLPTVQPAADEWAAAAVALAVDPAFAIESVSLTQAAAVAEEAAAAWPVGPRGAAVAGPRMFFELQSPQATVGVAVGKRPVEFDTARVTMVDISPGTVLGRTLCDVRVVAGEAFEITAEVADGWFIDAVERIEEVSDAIAAREGEAGRGVDWRVVRSPQGSQLRIGLATAATPRRGLRLRIAGHRSGIPLGGQFSTADLDMVRLPGEAVDSAALEFRVGPNVVVEAAGGPLGVEPASGRLAALVTDAAPRARIPAGERSAGVSVRLVRRRPPVAAQVVTAVELRDGRLSETFTCTCRPATGELDAVVVGFSEPLEPGLEWTLLEPAGATVVARPLDDGEGAWGEASRNAFAESWLLEVRPPSAGTVRLQGVRTVPLDAPRAIPLAWVDGALEPGGVVRISAPGSRLPRLVNRRLRELPPSTTSDGSVIELAYDLIPAGGVQREPAATIAPPDGVRGGGAWAWRERTSCWCHESGRIEWESTFDLENTGRERVAVTVPAGLRLESIRVAGEWVRHEAIGTAGAAIDVPLPAGRRLEMVIRGDARRDPGAGWWAIGPIRCGVDVPVLDTEVRLLLPPNLELFSPDLVRDGGRDDWASRLFLAGDRRADSAGSAHPGFSAVTLADAAPGAVSGAVVVRRRVVAGAAVAAGCVAGLAAFGLARRRMPPALGLCAVAAVAALWCPPPFDAVARGAWWGGIVGAWVAGRRRAAPRAIATLIAVAAWYGGPGEAGAAEDQVPLRVFVTPAEGGGTALVPEPLFRRLAEAAVESGPAAVRVLACGIDAGGSDEAWRLTLELETDRGGVLRLDQGPDGGAWRGVAAPEASGIAVDLLDGGRVARLLAVEAGRRTVALELMPAVREDGGLETATAILPPAARATLRPPPSADPPVRWQCDRAGAGQPWGPAARTAGGFDVSLAARVRLVRPLDAAIDLPDAPPAAVSFNDVAWGDGDCRVNASFEVGEDDAIVRSLLVRVDPVLEPVPGGPADPAVVPLGEGRHRIKIPAPRRGQRRIGVEFRMPLADPVGLFAVPGVWLEEVGADVRTVRLQPAAGLEAIPELPVGMVSIRPRAEDGLRTTAVWRWDVGAADAAGPAARIAVQRRVQPPRCVQDLAIDVAASQVGLRLRGKLDAGTDPLVEVPISLPPAAVIDRLVLTADAGTEPGGGAAAVDVFWSRVAADRIVAVVQRPRPGRFRLEVDARLPIRPASRGRLPLARVVLPGAAPLTVSWRAAAGLELAVAEPSGEGADARPREIAADAPAPTYELAVVPPGSSDDPPPPASAAQAGPAGSPRTILDLAIDAAGRVRGLVRIDLVGVESSVVLRLPPGLRLYDLRIDGREAELLPIDGATWEVRLHDVGWPRSLVAVVAGDLGGRLADGVPLRLSPPRIEGVPAGQAFWSLRTPAGLDVRLVEPGDPLDEAAWQAALAGVEPLLAEAFDVARASFPLARRPLLEAFAADRGAGRDPPGEADWLAAWRDACGGRGTVTRLVAPADGDVTIRAVTAGARAFSGRGVATVVIVAALVAAWLVAQRLPDAWRAAGPVVTRWWWCVAGVAWLALITPSLPGWLMLVGGGCLAIAPLVAPRSGWAGDRPGRAVAAR